VLWTAIDTYGCPQNAAVLREVIDELQEAVPPRVSAGAMEFVANGLFRIPHSQVAQLLSIILGAGPNTSYEIVDFRRPPTFGFRSDRNFIFRELDYPLNEGGSLSIVRKDLNSAGRHLDRPHTLSQAHKSLAGCGTLVLQDQENLTIQVSVRPWRSILNTTLLFTDFQK
jgi:hypothetical protein